MLSIGIKGSRTVSVTESNTARALGSGTLDVFATPAMIALIEATASTSVAPFLDEGSSTVGTHLDVAHSAATPVGMDVTCETELVEIDRRRLVFRVSVHDAKGEVGSGTHERFVVDDARFMSKARAKLERSRELEDQHGEDQASAQDEPPRSARQGDHPHGRGAQQHEEACGPSEHKGQDRQQDEDGPVQDPLPYTGGYPAEQPPARYGQVVSGHGTYRRRQEQHEEGLRGEASDGIAEHLSDGESRPGSPVAGY